MVQLVTGRSSGSSINGLRLSSASGCPLASNCKDQLSSIASGYSQRLTYHSRDFFHRFAEIGGLETGRPESLQQGVIIDRPAAIRIAEVVAPHWRRVPLG